MTGTLLPALGPVLADVERVAVLRANGIGDLVVALPALDALRAAYPRAEITYLGTPWHRELSEGRPVPWDRVLVVPPYPGVVDRPGAAVDSDAVRRFLSRRREEQYDLAVQLHGGGAHSNPFVTALGARVTVGARDHGAPALDRWTPYVYLQSEVLRFLEVVSLAGAQPVGLEPRLAVTTADRHEADQVLLGAGVVAGAPLVAVHPGAGDPRRRWPGERFGQLTAALVSWGARVVIVGSGEADAATARTIAGSCAGSGDVVDLVGALSTGGLLGVFERCAVVVGNDSGPRHLAGAVGAATVAVYWGLNVVNAGQLTRRRHRVAVDLRAACPVCGDDQADGRCAHDSSWVAGVTVGEVLTMTLDLLERG